MGPAIAELSEWPPFLPASSTQVGRHGELLYSFRIGAFEIRQDSRNRGLSAQSKNNVNIEICCL